MARADENLENIRVASFCGLSWSTIQRILEEEVCLRKTADHTLGDFRVQVWIVFKKVHEKKPHFGTKIITGDEQWCYA